MNAVISKLDISKHKQFLLKILFEISKDPILSRNLIFKGGTALLLFYGLNRFSTDLDFDLLDVGKEKIILGKLGKILDKFGKKKDLRIKKYTIFGLFSYGEIEHNIKIEINRRGLTGSYESKNLMGIDINVMNIEDMSANKFLALLGRDKLANRDIYDIFFIMKKGFDINKALIEEKSNISFDQYIKKIISFLEGLGEKYSILDGLGLVLEEDNKQYYKDNLLKETIFLLHTYL